MTNENNILFFSLILLVMLSGCAHNTPRSHFKTPITLPIETIESSGTLIPQPLSNAQAALLEKELDKVVSATGTKGISASVAVPDQGIWSSARGLTGNAAQEKVTADLEFPAGSIGKIFTAVVVLNLVDEGQVSLESPVAQWFPEIPWASRVTINQLLSHTAGIPAFDTLDVYAINNSRYRTPEELLSYVTRKELLFEPGQHYAYSNTGYLMLGVIIERVTGKSYEDAVGQYITDKVHLHQTQVITSATVHDLTVKGHHKGKVVSESENCIVPFAAGSIAATPSDLIIFLHALMSGRLLSQDSLQTMFTDMNLMTVSQSTYYGKGIVAALDTPVGDIIGHTGGIKGFGAALYYHPEQNLFVCVMMNDDRKSADPAVFRFLEAMRDR